MTADSRAGEPLDESPERTRAGACEVAAPRSTTFVAVYDGSVPGELLTIAAITLLAAIINGALGYGFSSITVPLALFLLTNRVLNPALVLIEVVLNAYVLFINRSMLMPRDAEPWPRDYGTIA